VCGPGDSHGSAGQTYPTPLSAYIRSIEVDDAATLESNGQPETNSPSSIQPVLRPRATLDVGIGIFPERERIPINVPFHNLFLAQKIEVSVTAGTRIDDGG
jgi:hypothetical protein